MKFSSELRKSHEFKDGFTAKKHDVDGQLAGGRYRNACETAAVSSSLGCLCTHTEHDGESRASKVG